MPTLPLEWWVTEAAQDPEVDTWLTATGGTSHVPITYGDIDLGFEVRMDAQGIVYERHWQVVDIGATSGYDQPLTRNGIPSMANAIVNLSDSIFSLAWAESAEPVMLSPQHEPLDIGQAFRNLLRSVSGVEGVLASRTPNGFSIAVVVNNASRSRRYAVYDREMQLLHMFPQVGVDFHLIDRCDQPLSELVSLELSDVYLRL